MFFRLRILLISMKIRKIIILPSPKMKCQKCKNILFQSLDNRNWWQNSHAINFSFQDPTGLYSSSLRGKNPGYASLDEHIGLKKITKAIIKPWNIFEVDYKNEMLKAGKVVCLQPSPLPKTAKQMLFL